ncbi:MAG: replication initiation protein [Bacteroidales bacterium]
MARPIKEKALKVEQSNYLTTAQYDYTPQEKRILYRIVEKAYDFKTQNEEWFKEHIGEYVAKEHVPMTLPVTSFMNKEQRELAGGTQYKEVTDAFDALVKKTISITFKTNSKGYKRGDYVGGSLVNLPELKDGIMSFVVHKFVWQSALDFSMGFTKLDLTTAMRLKSAYSMRFFEFAKKWSDTKYWKVSIEEFREVFGCVDKYPALYDLKRYIIDNAKKELDEVAPWSFNYICHKVGKKIDSFEFFFYENLKNKNEEEERKDLLSKYPQAAASSEIRQWFKHKMKFTTQQINSNIKLLDALNCAFQNSTIDELEETFQYISAQGCRPQENIGWFIQNLKKKVENANS